MRNLLVALGFEEAERQVFHFPLELPDAQAVGQRGIQVQRLARETGRARRLGLGMPAQALQPRRQPHQHDAQVGRHGQQHLALHLLLGAAFGLAVAGMARHDAQPQQRARALHQPRHLDPELAGHRVVAQGRRGGVQVRRQRGQHRGHAGGLVGMQAGQDAHRAGGMAGQRLAGQRLLRLEARPGPGRRVRQLPLAGIVQPGGGQLAPGIVERRRRIWCGRGGHCERDERTRVNFSYTLH
ncbi:Uncharacterised protein [Bordetella pertussis]|nr:Uncharacterised protein [Bordetella pertussis]